MDKTSVWQIDPHRMLVFKDLILINFFTLMN